MIIDAEKMPFRNTNGLNRYWTVHIYYYDSETDSETKKGDCNNGDVLTWTLTQPQSYFFVDCQNLRGNRIKIVKVCDQMNCVGLSTRSIIAGMAIFSNFSGAVDACTPDLASLQDAEPTVVALGS